MAIVVSCASCRKQYKVASETAGKKVRCKCGASIRVPPMGKKTPKTQPRTVPVADDSLFSFESKPGEGLLEESYSGSVDRPAAARKKGGGFSMFRFVVVPLFMLLMLATLGLLAGVVYDVPAAVNVATKLRLHPEEWRSLVLAEPVINSDVRYFPDNTQVVAVVNVDNLLKTAAFKQLEEEAAKSGIALADWTKLGGELKLDDVQRISVGLGADSGQPAIAVVRFKRAITPEEIEEAPMLTNLLFGLGSVAEGKEFSLAKPEEFKFEKNEVGKQNHVVYDSADFSFALVGDRGVAFGPKELLHKALERKTRNRLSRRLQEELARAEPAESAFVWAMTAAAIPADHRERLEDQLGGDYLKKVEAMSVSLRVGEEISLNVTLHCTDETTAEMIGKEAGEKLNLLKAPEKWIKDVPKELLRTTSATAGRRYTASVITDAGKIVKGKQAVTRLLLGRSIEDEEKPKDRDKPKDKEDKDKEKAKDKDVDKEKAKDKEKPKDQEVDKDKARDQEKAKDKAGDKDQEKGKDTAKDKDKAKNGE